MNTQSNVRNIRPVGRPTNSAPALCPQNVAAVVSEALRKAYGQERASAKAIARAANTNERTARNWLEGRALPNFMSTLRLMATTPELRSAMDRLTAMESDLDPEAERAMSALVQLLMRRRNE